MKAFLARIWNRILNEPALVVAVVLAAGNLIGEDLTEAADIVESLLVLLGGGLVRQLVTPVRKLDGGD